MQGLQKKYGKDRFQVLLVDVDTGYGSSLAQASKDVRECLAKHGITWPAAVDPNGWNGVHKMWKVDGYILTLIDPKGKVRAQGYLGDDLDRLLAKIYPSKA